MLFLLFISVIVLVARPDWAETVKVLATGLIGNVWAIGVLTSIVVGLIFVALKGLWTWYRRKGGTKYD